MQTLKLAFLGVGDVAQRDYLPELQRLAGRVELVAVCGRTEERVRMVAEQYGVRAAYTDYTRMLHETDADAVINLTPIQLHAETSLAALQAGKHLYSEKPLAGSVAEVARIRDEAQARGLTVVSAPCVMLFPQVVHAQSLLRQNVIGSVYSARGHGHGGVPPWSGYNSDPAQFFTAGGGPARDMGVYPLHALTGLLGPAKRVMAMSSQAQRGFTIPDGALAGKRVPIDVADNWHILLDFGGGRLATVAANNCVQGTRAPELEIFGLDGTIALDLLDVSAPIEVLRPGSDWEQVELPRTGRAAGPDHLLGIQHLVDCVTEGAQSVLSIEHALHVIEIIEKAAESAEGGSSVAIESGTGEPSLAKGDMAAL